MPTLRLDHVTKVYRSSRLQGSATLSVDLTVKQGEFVFLVGSRGSGKSTLMEIIAGELEPDHGTIWLDEEDLTRAGQWKRERLRRCIRSVLQDSELRRTETVFQNLAGKRRFHWFGTGLGQDDPRIEKALALVGMPGSGNRLASELSASESRRVELAGAICRNPSILVLDELTERADDGTVWDMLTLLNLLNRRGTTVIMTTRAAGYVNIMGKRVVVMSDGRVTSDRRQGTYME